jgi:tetratricopeptide (TPR) repeat protein
VRFEQAKPLMGLSILAGLLMASVAAFAGGGPNVTGAKLYIQQNELEQAIGVLQKEINEVNDKNEDAWYLLGYIYARQGKYDEMMTHFKKAVELKPKYKETGLKVSKDSGTKFHAESGVDKIVQIAWSMTFNDAVTAFNAGAGATDDTTKTKSFEQAVEKFDNAIKMAPDSIISYVNMAAALMNLQRFEDCIPPLKKAVEISPDDVSAQKMLARCYTIINHDSLAAPILGKLWESGTQDTETRDLLVNVYLKLEKKDEAKSMLMAAVEADPENYQARYNVGVLCLEADEYECAIENLQKVYDVDSTYEDVNYNLGAAYLNWGVSVRSAAADENDKGYMEYFKKAFPHIEESVTRSEVSAGIWFSLGQLAGQLNKNVLAGYAFAKGDTVDMALGTKIWVGMTPDALKQKIGEPDKVSPLESEKIIGVEEWRYRTKDATNGKIAVPDPMNIYVKEGMVDAILIDK